MGKIITQLSPPGLKIEQQDTFMRKIKNNNNEKKRFLDDHTVVTRELLP